jgi:hypothetical protein
MSAVAVARSARRLLDEEVGRHESVVTEIRSRMSRVAVHGPGGAADLDALWRVATTHPDHEVRLDADRLLSEAARTCVPWWLDAHEAQRERLASLGLVGRGEAYTVATATHVTALRDECHTYLRATQHRYETWLRAVSRGRDQPVGALLRAAAGPLDVWPPVSATDITRSMIRQVGWPIEGVRIETGADLGLRGGAWCEAWDVPGDVVVHCGPVTCDERMRDLLHECAHAAQFRATRADLAPHEKTGGDPGLVEAWGVAFERLLVWDHGEQRVREAETSPAVSPLDLVLARVQIARLFFALDLDAGDVEDPGGLHRRLFADIVGARPGALEWVRDLTPLLPGADRVRSWMLGAGLASHLETMVADGWPRLWEHVTGLWAPGQPAQADVWIAETLGRSWGAEHLVRSHTESPLAERP